MVRKCTRIGPAGIGKARFGADLHLIGRWLRNLPE
jgi:hypothetical protein